MRKVDPSLKVIGHALMVSKFATIVIGDRTNPLLIGHERFSDGLADCIGLFVLEGTDDGVQRFTLDQRYQGTRLIVPGWQPIMSAISLWPWFPFLRA